MSTDTNGESVAKKLASEIKGKTVIVTGVSPGGFGADTARVLALSGAKVVLAGRSRGSIQSTSKTIKEQVPDADLIELILDLESQQAVRKAADEVLQYPGPIDVVILNAGIMGTPYKKSVDGLELQFATNHIGNFLFINLIMPKLLESSSPRVVSGSSVGHRWAPVLFEDIGFEDGKKYDKWAAYGQSKTANILFAVELAERYKNKHLTAFACHPGGALTPLYRHMAKEDYEKFSHTFNPDGTAKGDWPKTPTDCIGTYVFAAFDTGIAAQSGSYVTDGELDNSKAQPYALDKGNAKKLWDLSEELVGQKFSV